ncbi:protein phosphatase 1 regulatory subunit 3G [Platysternon megacephalum]|uniref:Protein phosphatase 1 regulatory subunit 3G n=1 Tax=Platysternon megacephalum TaxID=55544 RepID=A0A4D9EEH0_9SAUR|nr:protein phosphatase 1 regulatory subunit 3G [Platysternon megacephalum]
MGCTPSHSEIANHVAKTGTNPLNKLKGILPVNPGEEAFSIPLLVKGSSCYDIDKFPQRGSLGKDHQLEKEEKTSELIKNVNFHLSSEDLSLSKIHEAEKKIERTATEAEIAMSELIESQKHIAEDIQIKKQSSCESEATAFTWDDKNESNAKQTPKKGKKQKSHKPAKQGRLCKPKEKSTPPICKTEKKVDFPDQLVKAHQNAYAYLNPNLSKYEAILCMANQATQTQLLLQQMVSFLVFRFDEINQLLEEIANDGEELLKEVGGNLAWPAGKGDPKEQPDLLQQLLQYTVNKMQLLNGTVASLTSSALQETWSYLQSAASNLEEKLKAKQGFDERLLRAIKLLEASAVVSSQAHADDRTLYSEDSGIGVDNESIKEFNSLDKLGRQTSCDSCAHDHPSQKHNRIPGEHLCNGTLSVTTRSHDCALERHFKDIFYPSVHSKGTTSSLGATPENVSTRLQCSNVTKSPSFNSLQSDAAQEGKDFKDCESIDSPSANEEEESTPEEDDNDNISLSEMGKNSLPRRPMSSPAVTDKTRRPSVKRIENPENEEMILKMKDAISEKIRFVPAKCRRKEWTEDEGGKAALTARPSTASGSQKTLVKQRRSRSEESLRSRAEDPTLLELQRTQKDLNKRLETFYMLNGNKETDGKQEILKPRAAAYLQDTEHVTPKSSTNKLKASLSKNFSILPNQDKVPLHKSEQNTVSHPDERRGRKPIKATASTQDLSYRKENEPPGIEKFNSGVCAPRKSVKKLIETFSPSKGLVKPTHLRTLGPIKCIRKFGLPVIPPTIPLQRALAPLIHKHRVSPIGDINLPNTNASHCNFPTAFPPVAELSRSDTDEETDEDLENLPPPPPEMLMDSSFDLSESEESTIMEGNSSDVAKKPAKTELHATKRMHISPKIKASLHSIDLLPSKNINSPNMIASKVLRNTGVDSKFRKYSLELNSTNMFIHSQEGKLASQRDHEMKEAADLYKQSHKIIPLQDPSGVSKQNRNCSESKKPGTNLASVQNQKQLYPDSLGRNEKSPAFVRRISPTRTPPSSPPTEKRLSSPPAYLRHILQTFNHFPPPHRQPSPPANPRVSSPPMQKKLPSSPNPRKLPSPPVGRKQSPPAQRREASPPPFCTTPSPPASPSRSYKVLQNSLDSGEEQQLSPPKIASNARSIFCPATPSLFEAKPPSPPSNCTTAVAGQPEVSAFAQKNSVLLRQCGDQQRRMALSAANPQPFIKRSFSDRRPGVYLRLPAPVSAGSEPLLNQASMEESPRKEGDSWNSTCFSEIKGSSRSASHPELYIVGQGLHRE